jgi:hypothetical protein
MKKFSDNWHNFYYDLMRILADREYGIKFDSYDDFRFEMLLKMYHNIPFSDYETANWI